MKAMVLNRQGVPWLESICGNCPYCRSGHENLCDAAIIFAPVGELVPLARRAVRWQRYNSASRRSRLRSV